MQVFSYGTTIYEQLLDYLQDDDLGDFSNGAAEIILTRTGRGKQDTSYRLRTNSRGEPFEFIGPFDDLVYDLDNIVPFPREGDMEACLSGQAPKKSEALAAGASTRALKAAADVEGYDAEAPVDKSPTEEVVKPKRTRRKKSAPATTEKLEAAAPIGTGSVEDIEAEMRKVLG